MSGFFFFFLVPTAFVSMSILLQGPSKLNINSPELIHQLAQCMLSIRKYTHTLKVHNFCNITESTSTSEKKSRKAGTGHFVNVQKYQYRKFRLNPVLL